jgi:Mg-chelatase subunit ChlD
VVQGDRKDEDVRVEHDEPIEELSGSLERNPDEDKLLHTIMENDDQTVKDGRLLQDALNAGLGNFTPDLLYEKFVKNYEEVEELYGETIVRELSGYEPSSLSRNIRIPEFRKVLKDELARRMKRLQQEGLLDANYGVTDKGFLLSAMVLIKDELDHLLAAGFGDHEQQEQRDEVGDTTTTQRRRYKDIDLRKTLKVLARRGHAGFRAEDLRFHEMVSDGKLSLVYCLDASGSMKGTKLALAKRAGVALAYEAIRNGDDVGLVTFGASVETTLTPSKRFLEFVQALVALRAKRETDIAQAIRSAVPLLSGKSKHIILLTDALHTSGSSDEVLAAAQEAQDAGVTISIIGIALDKEGEELSRKLVDISEGRFFHVQNVQELDLLILEDYARLKRG